jgi:FkbH-like protein
VLVEKGAHAIELKDGIKNILSELDARGILLSIASKNTEDEALEVLKRFDIADYFLHPQISWSPKSQAIATIASSLNINVESILFIDDQPFELEEVKTVHPQVMTLDAGDYRNLLSMEICNVPITEESSKRRLFYKDQIARKQAEESYSGEYFSFLRDCRIQLRLAALSKDNLTRVYELAQRTNQMNFSGNRYELIQLEAVLANPDLETYVLSCNDKFGDYGIIGFGIVDKQESRLIDLMFSCRIQSKRLEHAFLGHILKKYLCAERPSFFANYRKTSRNEHSGKVFFEMGFAEVAVTDGVSNLKFELSQKIPDDRIITITSDV